MGLYGLSSTARVNVSFIPLPLKKLISKLLFSFTKYIHGIYICICIYINETLHNYFHVFILNVVICVCDF